MKTFGNFRRQQKNTQMQHKKISFLLQTNEKQYKIWGEPTWAYPICNDIHNQVQKPSQKQQKSNILKLWDERKNNNNKITTQKPSWNIRAF